ncbi:flagellar biosynthesis protein FlhA [Niallia taxi]|uniref:flagellar biosynthesis protein FlhA n=1 Tax=Niallia taxi TaxID=2499688 RepID=UPI0015F77882|nr:flagellar biosynthesis protein FlhA [Niallia taxi]
MQKKDLTVLLAVIGIIGMMIIPLPNFLLDLLLMVNIALSLTILLVAMSNKEALEFSIFPSLLLLTTLFRLGLNVSTTRGILSSGTAGSVVHTFGEFVIGGNLVVGILIFLIFTIIQFIVITKGSERVSEVAARFALDAMPGKQMAIDADLNAGLIDEAQARARREKVTNEANFHGSMDGASKFVKGDAIAGLIITMINIFGGLIIGVTMMGMPMAEAAQNFTLLSIGDGLVSAIPALLISVATGIVVTRSASEGSLGGDLSLQLFRHPKLLYVVGGTLAVLGIVTPINIFLALGLGGIIAFGGYQMQKAADKKVEEEMMQATEVMEEEVLEHELAGPESVNNLLRVDPIEFEFGYGLIPLADKNQGGDLMERVVMIRRQLALDLGIVVPQIRIRDNVQLSANQYIVKIKGTQVAAGEIYADRYLAMSTGEEDEAISGIETVDPAFGLPALWLDEETKDIAELSGYTVVDPPSVISTHLTEVIKRHASELLGRQDVKNLIENVRETSPALIEELVPTLMTVGEIQKVLMNLLKEKVSIRNLSTILETLADYSAYSKDTDLLTEYVRQALARQISAQYAGQEKVLRAITAGATVEKAIVDAIQQTEHGSFLNLDPNTAQVFYNNVIEQVNQLQQIGVQPVLLSSAASRMYIRQFLERYAPDLPILSYNEIETDIEVQGLATVEL